MVSHFRDLESANIRVTMWNFRSHVEASIAFAFSGYGFQSEGKPITFRVTAGTLKEVTEERLIDYFSYLPIHRLWSNSPSNSNQKTASVFLLKACPQTPPAVEKVGADKYTRPWTCDPMGRCGRSHS